MMAVSHQEPLVKQVVTIDTNSAVNAKAVIKQLYRGLTRSASASSSQIELSEQELNEMLALAVRGVPTAKSRVQIEQDYLKADLSLRVPGNPFGDYINVTAIIEPFNDGFQITRLTAGDLKLSGRLVLTSLEWFLNQLLEGQTLGSELLAAVESLSIKQSNVALMYRPVPNFSHKVRQLKAQMQLEGNKSQRVRAYYLELCQFRQQGPSGGYAALASYLTHIFQFAEGQSVDSLQASEENRAALLALALFLGSERFDTVIGALDRETRRNCQPATGFVGLANRNDLRLHFIFSAALQVISTSGVSFSIGEFKELLDSGNGGSGFSFADLAADRAGIRFAEYAVAEDSAIQLQQEAAKLARETVFFPSIDALPEGIGQQEFEQRGGLESEFYRQYLAMIDRRIGQLPLYKTP